MYRQHLPILNTHDNISIIKYSHNNIETDIYSMDTLLIPDIIQIVTDKITLLGKHVSKYNLEIWNWKNISYKISSKSKTTTVPDSDL